MARTQINGIRVVIDRQVAVRSKIPVTLHVGRMLVIVMPVDISLVGMELRCGEVDMGPLGVIGRRISMPMRLGQYVTQREERNDQGGEQAVQNSLQGYTPSLQSLLAAVHTAPRGVVRSHRFTRLCLKAGKP